MPADSRQQTPYASGSTAVFRELSHQILTTGKIMERLRAVPFVVSSNWMTAGETTMVGSNKVQGNVRRFTTPPNAKEMLQRVRDSYSASSEGDGLTGADQAVLAAVKASLKHLGKAG
jgi:hypothetical protein